MNNSRSTLLSVTISLLLILSMAASAQTVTNGDRTFQLTQPAGWSANKPNKGGIILQKNSKTTIGFLQVVSANRPLPTASQRKQIVKEYAGRFAGGGRYELGKVKHEDFQGRKAYRQSFGIETANGNVISGFVVFRKGQTASMNYLIATAFTYDDKATSQEIVRAIQSFKEL